MELHKRAKNISLALIKIAVSSRRLDFRMRLERLSLDLLEKILLDKNEEVIEILTLVIGLVDFGALIYEIEPINANIVNKELNGLMSEISNKIGSSLKNLPNLPDIFIDNDNNLFNIKNKAKKEYGNIGIIQKEADRVINQNLLLSRLDNNKSYQDNTAIRQKTIIDKIRQSDKALQLKDIIAAFPGFSERTLRYDLQRACSEGHLERIGSGPASSYRVRVI